jgi:hypothetical protein
VALSRDSATLAVGACWENSVAMGISGDQFTKFGGVGTGAVYLY